jgi:hypothetical protein
LRMSSLTGSRSVSDRLRAARFGSFPRMRIWRRW